jgi:hypothetical protein
MRPEFVANATRIVVIGITRENKFLHVDFYKERELEDVLEKIAQELNLKPKDLFLVSAAQPDKELSLQKSLNGMFYFIFASVLVTDK